MPSVALDLVPPTHLWVPEHHKTFGPEVADLCDSVAFGPDPEQRLILDAVFAVDRRGRSAARDVGIEAPRQNIKTGVLKQCAVGWLFLLELRVVSWTAHEFSTAQEAFRDMCQLIESAPDLDREVKQIHRGNGDEAIELKGDRRLKFRARTRSGGRGWTGDRVVFDEAMLVTKSQTASLAPTLRAVPDPQLVFAGSGGLLESEEWRRLRDRGRPGGDPSLAWIGWSDLDAWSGCAEPGCSHVYGRVVGCALDDEDRLWRLNTALTRGRIDIESLRADRRLLDPLKYACETLGWWEDPPPVEVRGKLFPQWAARASTVAAPVGARMALGVDTSWDRSATWVAAATELPDGRVRTEIVATGRGTGWVRGWLFGGDEPRMDRLAPVGVAMQASGAPVSTLHDELTVHAPSRHRDAVKGLTVADMARASGLVFDLVERDGLTHVPHPALDAAVEDAVPKPMSDAWVIDRKKSGADAAPMVALSAAVAALVGHVPPPAKQTYAPRRIR